MKSNSVLPLTRCRWCLSTGEVLQEKLQRLLDRSIAIAAAYTRDPRVYPDADGYESQMTSGSSSSSAHSKGWEWPLKRPRKRLIGFVRAAGDGALVSLDLMSQTEVYIVTSLNISAIKPYIV